MSANRLRTVLEMIKFEHSVFALPFALTGALLAARAARHGWPTLPQILWIVVAMVAAVGVFFAAAWQLNLLALKLAPLAIVILFFYSFTKRFTNWSHLFLGFALGISPAAAWIAITGALD